MSEPTYHVLGIPFRTGSLYPGSENDARAYREVNLLQRLAAAGCRAIDEGDLAIPSYLPHHNIPPIKNWPGPRIAWDCIRERITPYLREPGQIPLLIGADCSIVVGTMQALMEVAGADVHLLYVDGDVDGIAPRPERCMSAAGMALWLATQESPFRDGPSLKPTQVTVVGWSDHLQSPELGLGSLPLAEVRRLGPAEAARQALRAIPASASILLHFDLDVINRRDMPAAYFPHADGLSLAEGQELLNTLLTDSRIRIIEVAEYASLRDLDQRYASLIVELLVTALNRMNRETR
ncbi:MAG TPA: arginase family protein [Blastocatellia bacterium]|nr:arginase family protein [Blastocatellia bacterium]